MYRIKRNLGVAPYLIGGILVTSLIWMSVWLSNPPIPAGTQFAPGEFTSRFSSTEIVILSVVGIIWLVLVFALLITFVMRHNHKKQFDDLVSRSLPTQQARFQPIALTQTQMPQQRSQQGASNLYNAGQSKFGI